MRVRSWQCTSEHLTLFFFRFLLEKTGGWPWTVAGVHPRSATAGVRIARVQDEAAAALAVILITTVISIRRAARLEARRRNRRREYKALGREVDGTATRGCLPGSITSALGLQVESTHPGCPDAADSERSLSCAMYSCTQLFSSTFCCSLDRQARQYPVMRLCALGVS